MALVPEIASNEEIRQSSKRVCAAMVTYYPDSCIAGRILAWLSEVPMLCVIDNGSDAASLERIRALAVQVGKQKVVLIDNRANLGIAAALNQAVSFAHDNNVEWLLTLDQDSLPVSGYVNQQFAALDKCSFSSLVAIVGGRAIETNLLPKAPGQISSSAAKAYTDWHAEKIVITSGSLYRCDTLVQLGGFRTDLFIDLVDTEYCLRLGQHGLRVIISDGACFYHQYGDTRVHRIGPFRLVRRLYPPQRNYYRFRNGVLLAMEWKFLEPQWALRRLVRLGRLLMNVIFLHDRKSGNLRMALLGIKDGLRRRTGPLP